MVLAAVAVVVVLAVLIYYFGVARCDIVCPP